MNRIVLNAAGGLANRMRAIASASALSADTSIPLTIIWHPDGGLNAVPS